MTAGRTSPATAVPAGDGAVDVRSCVELNPGEARYLLAIAKLARDDGPPSQAAVARSLEVSPPTVLEMVRRLRQLRLLEADSLRLTPEGLRASLVLSSRRSAARDLAHEVLGLDDEQAELEAERLAATASPELAHGLVAWRAAQQRR